MAAPRLEDTDRGLTVFLERYLYSKRNPARRPISTAEAVPVESRCLYIVPSPLLGYGLEELLERITGDSHVIAVEISQALFRLCAPRIGKKLLGDPKLSIVRLSDEESLQTAMDELGLWRFRRIRRVDLNGGAALFPEEYSRLTAFAIDALAAYWRNRHALGVLGRHWVKHLFANLTFTGAKFPRSLTGKPIVIAGAGPSVEDSLDFLSRFRDRVEIWATDTVLGTLLGADITPNVVSVLETQSWNHLDFHGAIGKGMEIMADVTSYPGSLRITGGGTSLYSSAFAKLSFLDRMQKAGLGFPIIPALGSVGLSAVHLALSCSDGPIFLTGLDFAYSPGKTHARGSSVHKWQLTSMSRIDPAPGWASTMRRPRLKAWGCRGRKISTDRVLAGYAELFRDRFGSSERIYMLTGGLDLAVPLVGESEALRLITHSQSGKHRFHSPPPEPHRRNAVMNFVRDEMQRLDSAIEAWENYNQGAGDAASVIRNLEELDHVYCDFPDKHLFPTADDSFLFRAIKRCRELRRYIQRISTE